MRPPELGTAQVLQGNALALPLADESVDLVVTSPPYFALRSYENDGTHIEGQIGAEPTPADFLEALWASMIECWRVLKPGGSAFVNLGDKYAGSGGHNNAGIAGKAIRSDPVVRASRRQAPDSYNKNSGGIRNKSLMGLPWRFAIGCIDGKASPCANCGHAPSSHMIASATPWCPEGSLQHYEPQRWILRAEMVWAKPNGLPENVKDRVDRRHEQFFHFTKQGPYFAAPKEHNSSVWAIPAEPLRVPRDLAVEHFAAFPSEWPRRLILGWCPEGGVVLDPFGGSGTTAMVAKALGRHGVSVDLSASYCRLAEWRINESGGVEKVRHKTYGTPKPKRRRRVLGQITLWGDDA